MADWTTIVFKYGAEWAPDSPGGLDVLELGRDGRFHYENRVQGQVTTVSGQILPDTLDQVLRELGEAGFPQVPAHNIPPGGSLVELVMHHDGSSHKALMDYFAALRFPGYGSLIRRLAAWTEWLRTGTTAHSSPPGLVRE